MMTVIPYLFDCMHMPMPMHMHMRLCMHVHTHVMRMRMNISNLKGFAKIKLPDYFLSSNKSNINQSVCPWVSHKEEEEKQQQQQQQEQYTFDSVCKRRSRYRRHRPLASNS